MQCANEISVLPVFQLNQIQNVSYVEMTFSKMLATLLVLYRELIVTLNQTSKVHGKILSALLYMLALETRLAIIIQQMHLFTINIFLSHSDFLISGIDQQKRQYVYIVFPEGYLSFLDDHVKLPSVFAIPISYPRV